MKPPLEMVGVVAVAVELRDEAADRRDIGLAAADDDRVIATLLSFGGDMVADDFEKWVVEGKQRNTDGALRG